MKAKDTLYQEIFKAGMKQEHKTMIGVAVDEGNKAFKAGQKEGRKEVGEWLAGITVSGNAVANELLIVAGIANLKRGEMPEIKEVKHE